MQQARSLLEEMPFPSDLQQLLFDFTEIISRMDQDLRAANRILDSIAHIPFLPPIDLWTRCTSRLVILVQFQP